MVNEGWVSGNCTSHIVKSGAFGIIDSIVERSPNIPHRASQVALVVKNPSANARDIRDASLIPGSGRSLEEETAMHSNIFAWRIPWTEEPGGLQSMGSHRIGHD